MASAAARDFYRQLTEAQIFVISFVALIALGTVGYRVLPGLYAGPAMSWQQSAFTSTSAVCVTGLIVVDTATYFTPLGQAYTLLLIQLGGLGVIALTSLIIVSLGRRLSLRQEAVAGSIAEVAPTVGKQNLIRDVVAFTFGIEAVGAVLLYALWVRDMGWRGAAWPAVFHSVSAFCNAGFSTFSDSLVGFQHRPSVLLVVCGLVVLGGLGFLTLEELKLYYAQRRRGRQFRVSLHSRIVLATTALLIVLPWPMFALFEWRNTLVGMPALDRVVNALFMAITPRTAGFNTIDYAEARSGSNFLTILLMSIGGSPGSTAGGLKTTTFAIIGLLAWCRFRGKDVTSLWSRSVPEETIQRAVGLFVVGFALVTAGIFVMVGNESFGDANVFFLNYMFESVSAFNTVGLSMNTTNSLGTLSQWTAISMMFLGRVGPLTLAAALAKRRDPSGGRFRYAYEDVVVG